MALYGEILSDNPGVHVPVVESALSTKRLLTMSWLDGAPLLDFKEAPVERRNDIAQHMFNAWYVPFYRYGVLHGDPHLGNYTVRPNGEVNLLDYGCIRVFGSRFIQGVIDLYHAVKNDDRDLAISRVRNLGLHRSVQRDGRRAQHLGRLHLRAPDRRPDPADRRIGGAANSADKLRPRCIGRSGALVA